MDTIILCVHITLYSFTVIPTSSSCPTSIWFFCQFPTCVSCKPFSASKYSAVSLFSPSLCLCQTGRVPLRTRHWRCSSESAGGLRGESVFYPQQWVWITHARSRAAKLAAPQKLDRNHNRGPQQGDQQTTQNSIHHLDKQRKTCHASRCTTWIKEALFDIRRLLQRGQNENPDIINCYFCECLPVNTHSPQCKQPSPDTFKF